jgi:hypothetical protein
MPERSVVGGDQRRGPGQRRLEVSHVDRVVGAHQRRHLLENLFAEPVVQREKTPR